MNDYRIYHMDAAGLIVGGLDAKCESDEAACEMARRLIGIHDRSEVWLGSRCVGQVFLRSPTIH